METQRSGSNFSWIIALGLALPLACGGSETEEDSGADVGETAATEATSSTPTTDSDTDAPTGADSTGAETSDPPMSGFGQPISGGGTADGYSTLTLQIGEDEYKVQTNPWGGATQTITAGSGAVFRVDSITHPTGGNDWDVASFPSVYKGVAQGGEPTADSGMPVAIEDISNIWTGLKANTVSNTYQGNTTYDVYFTHAETYVGGPPDTYLMVWYDAKGLNPINGEGEGWNCNAMPPTYVDSCSGSGDVTIAGTKFYRFIGNNGGHGVISYVPETRMGEWEFDLKAFIDDAVAQGVLTPAMYMQSVQAGLELADGGVGLTIEDFYIDIL